jgi:hypothetical protein
VLLERHRTRLQAIMDKAKLDKKAGK